MTLLEIINVVNYIVGDRRPETGVLTPKRFSEMLNMASLKHFKRKLGLPEEYQVGMPLPRQAFDITQKITEDLRPFKKLESLTFVDGLSSFPEDYYYPSSLFVIMKHGLGAYKKKATFVTDSRWDEMHGNYVDIPNEEYPIVNLLASHLRVSPVGIKKGELTYLRLPIKPVYATKVVSDMKSVYDPDNSVQLEWDEINQIDIIAVLLSDLGLPLMRGDIIQMAEKQKAQGI